MKSFFNLEVVNCSESGTAINFTDYKSQFILMDQHSKQAELISAALRLKVWRVLTRSLCMHVHKHTCTVSKTLMFTSYDVCRTFYVFNFVEFNFKAMRRQQSKGVRKTGA